MYNRLFRGLLEPGQGGCGTLNPKATRANMKKKLFIFRTEDEKKLRVMLCIR